jgi:sialate O-acetylesterase
MKIGDCMFDINAYKLIIRTCLLAVFASIVFFRSAYGVQLHPFFQDNMVLQFGKKVNIWGTADIGETVSVSINGQTKSATAINGKWLVQLDAMEPGGPYTLTVRGANTISIKNVRIGDVWIVSGQSNAYTAAGAISECVEAYETFQSEDVRLMSIAPTPAGKPMNFPRNYIISGVREKENRMHLYNQWYACSWNIAREFSAMGLAHTIKIHQETGMPTAVIQCVMGSTKIALCPMKVEWLDNSTNPIETKYGRSDLQPSQVCATAIDLCGLEREAFGPANRSCNYTL